MNFLELIISNDISELRLIQQTIEKLGNEWKLTAKLEMNLNLVLEEVISNIIFYGYEDDLQHKIIIEFRLSGKEIMIMIKDDAKAFDISDTEEFGDAEKAVEERHVGGLGIHFVKTMMDRVSYKRDGEINVLSLWKKI